MPERGWTRNLESDPESAESAECIAEMTERVSGMHGAMRKANEILFEERLQQIESDLRAALEEEMERLETEALERVD